MGRKNYSNYSKNFNKNTENNEPEIKNQISEKEEAYENNTLTEATVHQEIVDIEVTGIVTGCRKLYVRKEASKDSEPLEIINEFVGVMVTISESTDDFYKVYTPSGVEGYCMKKFISIV